MTAAFASKLPSLLILPLFTLHVAWLIYRKQ
jgi:hypothetical protein